MLVYSVELEKFNKMLRKNHYVELNNIHVKFH